MTSSINGEAYWCVCVIKDSIVWAVGNRNEVSFWNNTKLHYETLNLYNSIACGCGQQEQSEFLEDYKITSRNLEPI